MERNSDADNFSYYIVFESLFSHILFIIVTLRTRKVRIRHFRSIY